MPTFNNDSIEFHYLARGSGLPVVFQHGLGSDTGKVFAQVELPSGYRLLGLDCRGHGQTKPLGTTDRLGFNAFADDVGALLKFLDLPAVVIGGTSMGAGVALNFTLRYPQKVRGLILLRPAWLDEPNQNNLRFFTEIASLLRQHGPSDGAKKFKQSNTYREIARESSDSAASLLSLFSDPRALETMTRLERIPKDAPNHDRKEWQGINVPTLVLSNRSDPIHPFHYGQILSESIPGAEFKELTPKSVNLGQYLVDLRAALADFLHHYFPQSHFRS